MSAPVDDAAGFFGLVPHSFVGTRCHVLSQCGSYAGTDEDEMKMPAVGAF